ncbi:hypothetical protein [Psychrobium sp. 1_MG-2023]|uniref:hypothetical protein n=1 Tax=Psychrobium sp. 1_MG-2023 TaxID=3062624 RepID=UPI000C33448D|nr:hypothetical protein [Psychrobium sp. 1_MG-2023]MDP2559669.1 hypothetical protein [Psychrobium sp. 1_MG-2023]PKF59500.1 hypothetical protein CW748_01640 [Alteromonadales bacterium alter-6D02]
MNNRFYGEFDPIEQSRHHIAPCANCQETQLDCVFDTPHANQQPGNQQTGNKYTTKPAYFVNCPNCHAKGLACKKEWQAIIAWNKSPLAEKGHYRELPLFNLGHLTKEQAKKQLIAIRTDLERRKHQAVAGQQRLDGAYFERLRAFLAWVIYAQVVLKFSDVSDVCEEKP